MKMLFAAILLSLSASASANNCYSSNSNTICSGDLIFLGEDYTRGAIIQGINPIKGTLTAKSVNNGAVNRHNITDVDYAKVCARGLCPGDVVFKGDEYIRGATVEGINLNQKDITVKSINNGAAKRESIKDVDYGKGCIHGYCVGDVVFKGDEYKRGATIVGVNLDGKRVTVKSINNGAAKREKIRDLDIQDQCVRYTNVHRALELFLQ